MSFSVSDDKGRVASSVAKSEPQRRRGRFGDIFPEGDDGRDGIPEKHPQGRLAKAMSNVVNAA